MLKVSKLKKRFEGITAVSNCSFEVKKNNIVALIGPNGAGKTTVLNIITGLVKPDKGSIEFKNSSIVGLSPYKISNLGMARTFQLIRLFPNLTVMENLLLANRLKGESVISAIFMPRLVKKEEKANKKSSLDFLRLVGLEKYSHTKVQNLSYGQQKLLELARCLATEAELILLDEPVAGVNQLMREKIKQILLELKREGKAIFFIEHDMNFVMDIADYIVVMDHGEEIAIGTPAKIQKNQKVLDAYLGHKVKL